MQPHRIVLGALLSLALLGGGCGKGSSEDPVAGMKGFKDKMCACKDAACAATVDSQQVDWRMKTMKKAGSREAWEKIADSEAWGTEYAAYEKCQTALQPTP